MAQITSSITLIIRSALAMLVLAACLPAEPSELPEKNSSTPDAPRSVVLKEGTEMTLKFAQNLTSKAAVVGQPVELALADDLKVGDALVVRKNARVLGTVIAGKESEEKRHAAKELVMRVDFLRTGDHRIKLRGTKVAEGKRNKQAMVAGTIVFGLAGLLATSGKKFVIPEGAPLTAFVDEDIELPVIE